MLRFLLTVFVLSIFCINTYADAISDYEAGKKAYAKKEYQTALEYFESAILKDAEYKDAYYGKGEVEIALKKNNDALESFTKIIELDPENTQAYLTRSFVYAMEETRDFQKAKEDLDKVIELDENNLEALQARALVNYELKNKLDAYKDIEQVILIAPDEYVSYGIKAYFEVSDYKFISAIKDYNKFKKLRKDMQTSEEKQKFEDFKNEL